MWAYKERGDFIEDIDDFAGGVALFDERRVCWGHFAGVCVVLGALVSVWVLALIWVGDAVMSGRDRQGCVLVVGKAEGVGGDW